MKFSLSVDYAIRILLYLHRSEERIQTGTTIATAVGTSYPYVLKLTLLLKDGGFMDTVQGRYGGYALRKPVNQINLYDVYLAINGELKMSPCCENRGNPHANRAKEQCMIYEFFHDIQENIIAQMESVTIADLAAKMEGDMKKKRTYSGKNTLVNPEHSQVKIIY